MGRLSLALVLCLYGVMSHADLSDLAGQGLESYLANIPQDNQQSARHAYQLRANFDLGSQDGRLSDCRNNKPRKEQSFYPCWNHQSQIFFDKLSYTLEHHRQSVVPTEFRFTLTRMGRLEDIQVFGIQDEASKKQLIQLLEGMEFGYSYRANNEPVVLSVDTHRLAQH